MKKRLMALFTALLALFMLWGGASAADEYADIGELYFSWFDEYGNQYYPPYICGVWSEDGTMDNLVVALTDNDAGRAGEKEILELIKNDDSVQFRYMKYSHSELTQVMKEIAETMPSDYSVVGCGVNDMKNCVDVRLDENHPDAEKRMNELFEKYGDKVTCELGSIVMTKELLLEDIGLDLNYSILPWIAAVVITAAAAVAVIMRIRRSRAAVTPEGEVISDAPVSRAEAKKICSEASVSPSKETDDKIITACRK